MAVYTIDGGHRNGPDSKMLPLSVLPNVNKIPGILHRLKMSVGGEPNADVSQV